MDEREQLEAQWASMSVAERETLFRSWIFAAAGESAPAHIAISDSLGDELITYAFAADLSAWQVAVAPSVFDSTSPGQALGIGDAIIEISRLFADEQEEDDEEEEFEQEDESAEGAEAAWEAAIETAIEGLEAERDSLAELLSDADDDADAIQSLIDFLNDLINELNARLGEQEASV